MYYSRFIILIMILPMIAMENKISFSIDQVACFDFFDKNPAAKHRAFKRLAKQDKNNVHILAQYFFEEVRAANITISPKCNAENLVKTLEYMKQLIEQKLVIRPTDTLTARIYVFSQLTPEEQAIISPEKYHSNKEKANDIIMKMSFQYALSLFNLNIVPARKVRDTACDFFTRKTNELEEYESCPK